MTQTSAKLTRWIIKLATDLLYLRHRAAYLDAAALKNEIRRYQQTIQVIYAEAQKLQIDLLPYATILAESEANLKIIESGLHPIGPLEKIALFLDGANLNAITHDFLRVKIDYAKLLTFFSQNAVILRAFYYLAIEADASNFSFLVWLKRNGYQVITKPLKEFDDGHQKGNLDIEIAIDMLELADKVDRAVLFSGDGDFAPLLKAVGRKGARTQVVSYWGRGEGPTAPELIEVADTFTELKDILPYLVKTGK